MTENMNPEEDGAFEETAISEEDAMASIEDEKLREAENGETGEG
ncbi:hypothetical protein [Limnobacter sp. MED105]|nr:hypothetical protein [Limnobacter sp. MED105]EDM82087.1 hypothetical protein LMED105_00030 [Limnobacter sp. MED105]